MNQAEADFSETNLTPVQFDHHAWANAQPILITKLWSGEPAPAERHAEARLVWSPEALNVRFVCNQNEPMLVNAHPQLDKKTIGLWDRDVCELFLAPKLEEPTRYFEFEAAPTGDWVDLTVNISPSGEEKDFEFETGMTVVTRIERNRLTIGMYIPWTDSLPRPVHGAQMRGNLFRCIGTGNERYMAWLPTFTAEPNFHVPDAFGWINFE